MSAPTHWSRRKIRSQRYAFPCSSTSSQLHSHTLFTPNVQPPPRITSSHATNRSTVRSSAVTSVYSSICRSLVVVVVVVVAVAAVYCYSGRESPKDRIKATSPFVSLRFHAHPHPHPLIHKYTHTQSHTHTHTYNGTHAQRLTNVRTTSTVAQDTVGFLQTGTGRVQDLAFG
jgi:hypothetical protein